jgi:2-(1,2-epoxy-1,2-dihydrophenyl)acetyl-CoA isomerase
MGDVSVTIDSDFVTTVEICRGPNNYFDVSLVRELADIFIALETDERCRAIVLASEGKNFCAGAILGPESGMGNSERRRLYDASLPLFSGLKPVVAAIQGAAIGGGLGLSLVADFRVTSSQSRLSANFARFGFFPGFGLTLTLPALVGQRKALELFYTGKRISGDEAFRIGLSDLVTSTEAIRSEAHNFARELSLSAPLSVMELRRNLRNISVGELRVAMEKEADIQDKLELSEDFREGLNAMRERRIPNFQGK